MTLREYLEKSKLNLSEFSKASSVPISSLSRFIRKERRLSLKSMAMVSKATGNKVSIQDLFKENPVNGS